VPSSQHRYPFSASAAARCADRPSSVRRSQHAFALAPSRGAKHENTRVNSVRPNGRRSASSPAPASFPGTRQHSRSFKRPPVAPQRNPSNRLRRVATLGPTALRGRQAKRKPATDEQGQKSACARSVRSSGACRRRAGRERANRDVPRSAPSAVRSSYEWYASADWQLPGLHVTTFGLGKEATKGRGKLFARCFTARASVFSTRPYRDFNNAPWRRRSENLVSSDLKTLEADWSRGPLNKLRVARRDVERQPIRFDDLRPSEVVGEALANAVAVRPDRPSSHFLRSITSAVRSPCPRIRPNRRSPHERLGVLS
jgi:hypothetical protein